MQCKIAQVKTRSMTRKNAVQNDINTANTESIEEPKIMHASSNSQTKGIPIIHTSVVSDNGGLVLRTSLHAKYRSKNVLCRFDIPVAKDVQFIELFLSRLEKLASKCDVNRVKIFLNELIFKEISIENFVSIGNKALKSIKILLLEPVITVDEEKDRKALIKRYHDDPIFGGHPGVKRLLAKLKQTYTWKNMIRDVTNYVQTCHKCQVNKPKPRNIEHMVLTKTPQKPFDKIVIDTVGPLMKSSYGNVYVLTMMCDMTKYLVTAAIPDKEARTIAKAILERVILVYGPIKELLSDRGTEFVNSVVKELCEMLHIEQKTSVPYHHQTVGSVERNHRVFNEYLRSYLTQLSDWEEYLKYFNFCYNCSFHASFEHKLTPFELVFARKPNVPEIMLDQKVDPIYNIENYAKEAKYRLQLTNKLAREMLDRVKHNVKNQYDKKSKPLNLSINDKVIVVDEARHKHQSIYIRVLSE